MHAGENTCGQEEEANKAGQGLNELIVAVIFFRANHMYSKRIEMVHPAGEPRTKPITIT